MKISHLVYPPPPDVDFSKKEDVKELLDEIPFGSLIMIVIGWAIGSFAGGAVATLISPEKKQWNALVVGGVLMLIGILNMFLLPHPLWMWFFALIVYLPFAYFGSKIFAKKQPAA